MDYVSFVAVFLTVLFVLLITFANPAPLDTVFNLPHREPLAVLVPLSVPQIVQPAPNLMSVLDVFPVPAILLLYSMANVVYVTYLIA